MFGKLNVKLLQSVAVATIMVAGAHAAAYGSTSVRTETLKDRVAASRMKIRGVLQYKSAWMMLAEDKKAYGVYEFPVSSISATAKYNSVKTGSRFGVKECFSMGDKYWTAYAVEENYQILSMTFYTYDANTWNEISDVAGDPEVIFSAVSWSEKDKKVYAVKRGAIDGYSANIFGWFDYKTGYFHTIGRADSRMQALAVHSDGTIYGVEENGYLVTVNAVSGDYTVIGHTGLKSFYATDCTIDSEENVMYFVAAMSEKTSVYAIDLDTGSSMRVYDLPDLERVRGLYMWPDVMAQKVPAAASELKLNFQTTSLSGTVSFKTPATHYDGTTGTGTLHYAVIIGNDVYEGDTDWNTSVSVPVEFKQSGERKFAVRLSNNHGASPALRTSAWIGKDKPRPVTDTEAIWTNGGVNISWGSTTGSMHGGYFNPQEVTYTVIRREDGTVVAEGVKSNEVVDAIKEPCNRMHTLTYSIIPYLGEMKGDAEVTAPLTIGFIHPLYRNTFDDISWLDGFVTLDSNDDEKTWKYYEAEQCVRIAYNTKKDMDDWLFTPEIQLTAGRECTFSFKCKAHDNETVERLSVAVASDTIPDSVIKTLIEPTEIKGTEWIEMRATFMPTVSGRYRLAFHGMSEREQFYLYLDDLVVDDGTPAGMMTIRDEEESIIPTYYTLDGLRVARPEKGIYIEVRGDKRRKKVF